MASAKRAKSKSKGKRVEAKQSRAPLRAKAPKAASLAKQATKAIKRSVKSVADTAKKVAAGAKKGVSKQAAAVAEQATLAKKSVAKKAKRVAKQAAAARESVAKQAKSVAKQAKATVVEKAGKAKQAARVKAGVMKESPNSTAPDAGANGTVAVGSPAPSFSLPDQDGNVVTSESLKGAPYVLYFYPKDDTPGCTKEACGFRDSGAAFGKNGVRVLGVSPDSENSHARFAEKYGLPFTLLSDVEKKLAAAYGVWVEKTNYGRKYMGIERSTFLVDGKGRVQKIWRGVRVPGHVEDVLLASGTI